MAFAKSGIWHDAFAPKTPPPDVPESRDEEVVRRRTNAQHAALLRMGRTGTTAPVMGTLGGA